MPTRSPRRERTPRTSARDGRAVRPARWFLPSTIHPVREGNSAVGFVTGEGYYADLAAAIRSASGPGSFVELANWDIRVDFLLVPGDPASTLADLLTEASARGVVIRVLACKHQEYPLWGGTFSGYDNRPAVEFVNALPTGAAIHDNRYLNTGTHHQKIAVVGTAGTLTAWSGGMDLNPDRLADSLTDRKYHDVQVRYSGPIAYDHHVVFAQRWMDNPDSEAVPPLPSVTPPPMEPRGTLQFQLVTTYGNGSVHAGIVPGRGATEPGYTFAHSGDQSILALVRLALGKARRFVYVEDQYLVDPVISGVLQEALGRIERLVIVMPPTEEVNAELRQGWRRRAEFLEPLLAAAPEKVAVVVSTTRYVHSKTWVIDDEFAIVGSANCNRRGYTHDSEASVGVYDTGDSGWVATLRQALWAKHLGRPASELVDALGSAHLFVTPPPSAVVSPYDVRGGTDAAVVGLDTDLAWTTLIDPDGS